MFHPRFHLLATLAALPLLLTACGGSGTDGSESGSPAVPAPQREEEPSPWSAAGTWDQAAFAWGLQTGDATESGVILSLRSTESTLSLALVKAEGEEWVSVDPGVQVTMSPGQSIEEPTEWVTRVELENLEPDTAYSCAFYAQDGKRRSPVARFRTALDDDGWRVLTFGGAHGFGGNYPWPSLSHAADQDLDFFMLLGDTVYADGSLTLDDYRQFWRTALSTQGLMDMSASTSLVATWDDHEVANNWTQDDLQPGQFDAALEAYREALPQREGPGGTGIWRILHWGKVADVFVLDCRGERTATDYLSQEQMDWLKDSLLQSDARFKFIMSSVPITDYDRYYGDLLAEDRWQGYPEQRDEILSFVADNSIPGVLWTTGDFHSSIISYVDMPGEGPGGDQLEVMVGPVGSTLGPAPYMIDID